MADKNKKQTSLSMFERAGQAMVEGEMGARGHYIKPFDMMAAMTKGYNAVKAVSNQVEKGKKKSADLLKGFKNISVSKVPTSFQPKLKNWLIGKREEYATAAEIIAQGTDHPEYHNAIDQQTLINEQLKSMSSQLDVRGQFHQNILDRQKLENKTPGLGRSAAMTNIENTNFDNILQENYGPDGLNLEIIDNQLLVSGATADPSEYISFDEINVGSGYDNNPNTAPNSIEAQYKAAMKSVRKLAQGDNFDNWRTGDKVAMEESWTQSINENPRAIIETMYNNKMFTPFLDGKIADIVGITSAEDFKKFKEGNPIISQKKKEYQDKGDLGYVLTYAGIMEMLKNSGENFTDDLVPFLMDKFQQEFDIIRDLTLDPNKTRGGGVGSQFN